MATPSDPESAEKKPERSRVLKVSLRVGESVAVLGLVLAGLNYWDGRQERAAKAQAEAQAEQRTAVRQARAAALVLRGEADGEGERVFLAAADPDQVVQSQRYIFPRAVREQAREIGAGRPQIDRAWVEDGLKRERRALEQSGAKAPAGEDQLPVAVVTAYIEEGVTRRDVSIYRLGYVVQPGLLGRSDVELQGVSLLRRLPADAKPGAVQDQLDALWTSSRPPPNR
jgi:hypothetical protein